VALPPRRHITPADAPAFSLTISTSSWRNAKALPPAAALRESIASRARAEVPEEVGKPVTNIQEDSASGRKPQERNADRRGGDKDTNSKSRRPFQSFVVASQSITFRTGFLPLKLQTWEWRYMARLFGLITRINSFFALYSPRHRPSLQTNTTRYRLKRRKARVRYCAG